MTIVYGVGILLIGILLGFMFRSLLLRRLTNYDGVIEVEEDEESGKLIYALILNDDAEQLKDRNKVSFKVVSSNVRE